MVPMKRSPASVPVLADNPFRALLWTSQQTKQSPADRPGLLSLVRLLHLNYAR